VAKYIKGEGGSVILNNEKELEVSRRKKQEFLNALKN
jgi:two-component system LytT family response regulator